MLKILYLLNHAGKAGTEKYVRNLVEAFHNKKAECFFAYNEGGLLVEQLSQLGIGIYQINMKNPFDISAAIKLSKLCKQLGIDIIHTQYPRENYIAILSKLFNPKVKVIYTNHLTLTNNFVWKMTNRIMTPANKAIIAVCNKGKELMIENGIPGSKIKVIFNGVIPSGDMPAAKGNHIRKEFGISDNEFVILTLARFAPEKGLAFLVKSIAKLKEITDQDFKCMIVGDGPLFDEIKQLITELRLEDCIILTGYRTDAEDIVKASDLFINSASGNEALSFAILEAMDKGLPVIATDVGGNSDIVNQKHDCGILVQYGDELGMANAINTIMSNRQLYDKYSKNAIKTIHEVFNLKNILEETYKVYIK